MGNPVAPPLLIVAGPTASGKSALGLDLAREFDGVIINADSMQVYRELRILTARPSDEDEALVPHRLYGVLSVRESCSVARWLEMARREIENIRAAKKLPIVVGGSGLYIEALTQGLLSLPEVPEALRRSFDARYREIGGDAFRDETAGLDPAALSLPQGDRQRLVRLRAVVEATGRTLASWRDTGDGVPPVAGRIATIVLLPPRETLYAACDGRFMAMLEKGALGEAEAIAAMHLPPDAPAAKVLGLDELSLHLSGGLTFEQAAAKAKQVTRNYAKRQTTWLRHRVKADLVISEQYSESLQEKIFSFVRRFLLTGQA